MSIIVTVNAEDAITMLGDVAKDITPDRFMKVMGERFKAWVNQNFREEGAEAKWKPLSPNTIAARRKGKGSGSARILRDTGRMAQSFTTQVGRNMVEVGTADQKALFHQAGTKPHTVTKPSPTKTISASGKVRYAPGGKPMRFMTARGWRSAYSVRNPGVPIRALLPSQKLAEQLAVDVARAYIERALGGTVAAK